MTDDELTVWLDRVARERLADRPDLLVQFRSAMQLPLEAVFIITRAQATIPPLAMHGVAIGHDGSIKTLQDALTGAVDWFVKHRAHSVPVVPIPERKTPPRETAEQRQARRYQMCVDAGLTMPTDDYAHMPDGIKEIAKREGIRRQSFVQDLKAHINRLNPRGR